MMDDNFKEYIKQVKKVYDLVEVSEENEEALLEYIKENSKLFLLTEKYLREIENVN